MARKTQKTITIHKTFYEILEKLSEYLGHDSIPETVRFVVNDYIREHNLQKIIEKEAQEFA